MSALAFDSGFARIQRTTLQAPWLTHDTLRRNVAKLEPSASKPRAVLFAEFLIFTFSTNLVYLWAVC
jgi:hypothetical protein